MVINSQMRLDTDKGQWLLWKAIAFLAAILKLVYDI
jgi:hypothetical protein